MSETKTEKLMVLVTPSMKKKLVQSAKSKGISVAELVRRSLNLELNNSGGHLEY